MEPASSEHPSHEGQYYHCTQQQLHSIDKRLLSSNLGEKTYPVQSFSYHLQQPVQMQQYPPREKSTRAENDLEDNNDYEKSCYNLGCVARPDRNPTEAMCSNPFSDHLDQRPNTNNAAYDDLFVSSQLSCPLSTAPSSQIGSQARNASQTNSNVKARHTATRRSTSSPRLGYVSPDHPHSRLSFRTYAEPYQPSNPRVEQLKAPIERSRSRSKKGMVGTAENPPLSPSPPLLRSNKIYIRIKRSVARPPTKKVNRLNAGSAHSFSINGSQQSSKKRMVNGQQPHRRVVLSTHRANDLAVAGWQYRPNQPSGPPHPIDFFMKNQAISNFDKMYRLVLPSHDKIVMIRNLLSMECGPLWWDLEWKPPDSFVLYLADVLTRRVKEYLQSSARNLYWIKHVRFWRQLLDPERSWWNIGQGSIYNDFAKRLFFNHLARWGSHSDSSNDIGDLIECHDPRDQSIFLRACILFASSCYNSSERKRHEIPNYDDEDESLSNDRHLRHYLLQPYIDEYMRNHASVTIQNL